MAKIGSGKMEMKRQWDKQSRENAKFLKQMSKTFGLSSNKKIRIKTYSKHKKLSNVSYVQTNVIPGTERIIDNNINNLQSVEYDFLCKYISNRIIANNFANVVLFLGIVLSVFFGKILLLVTAFGILLKLLLRTVLVISLDFEVDDNIQALYKLRFDKIMSLATCSKIWQITSESQAANTKTNAGAVRNVSRFKAKVSTKTPFYLKSNIELANIKLHSGRLIFTPDTIILIKGNKVGIIEYEDVKEQITTVPFTEREAVPTDAIIIGKTWQYVNKNGTPDKRYKNNYQLNVCQYGLIRLTSNTGLNTEIQCSKSDIALNFSLFLDKK